MNSVQSKSNPNPGRSIRSLRSATKDCEGAINVRQGTYDGSQDSPTYAQEDEDGTKVSQEGGKEGSSFENVT